MSAAEIESPDPSDLSKPQDFPQWDSFMKQVDAFLDDNWDDEKRGLVYILKLFGPDPYGKSFNVENCSQTFVENRSLLEQLYGVKINHINWKVVKFVPSAETARRSRLAKIASEIAILQQEKEMLLEEEKK